MWTEHPHTRLFLDTFILVHTSHCGSRCRTTCLHKTCSSTCHHMCERLLLPCFVFFFCLSCLYVLSLLPVLCSELQLPRCRERRALNPKRTRQMRSIAPWRYTTLSQCVNLPNSAHLRVAPAFKSASIPAASPCGGGCALTSSSPPCGRPQ